MQRYMSLPTVAVLAILVYIVFFGESSVTQRIEYQRQIDSLSAEVAVVQDSVDYYRELNRRLASEPEAMERVVREQYNMKREHEDVFVVVSLTLTMSLLEELYVTAPSPTATFAVCQTIPVFTFPSTCSMSKLIFDSRRALITVTLKVFAPAIYLPSVHEAVMVVLPSATPITLPFSTFAIDSSALTYVTFLRSSGV